MNRLFQFRSIQSKFTIWFLIIAIIPLALISTVLIRQIEQLRKATLNNRLEAVRTLKQKDLINWIDEKKSETQLLARLNEVKRIDSIRSDTDITQREKSEALDTIRQVLLMYALHDVDIIDISVLSAYSGNIVVSSEKKLEGLNRSDSPDYLVPLGSGKLTVREFYYDDQLHRPSLAFSVPISDHTDINPIAGILVVRYDLQITLNAMLHEHPELGSSENTFIFNSDGISLYAQKQTVDSSDDDSYMIGRAIRAFQGRTGRAEMEDARGEKLRYLYTTIPDTQWTLVVSQKNNELFPPLDNIRNWTFIVGSLTIIGVIFAAYYVAKSISGPIRLLQKGSKIIGDGNLEYRVGTEHIDEIGELSRHIDQMMDNIKELTTSRNFLEKEIVERENAEKMLRESEERYRMQFSESRDAIFISDAATGVIVDCNQSATDLVGLERAELIGRHQSKINASGKNHDDFNRLILEQAEKRSGELLFTKIKSWSGSIKHVSIKANIIELKGKKYLQYIFRDMTEQRKLERTLVDIEEYERHRLGYELHDGLGQLLAGVAFKSRYLETSLKEKSITEARDAARITVLIDEAKDHVRHLAKGTSLADMDSEGMLSAIQKIVDDIKRIFGISCIFQHDNAVKVYNSNTALQVFRIIQEAVTNAAKHGNPTHIAVTAEKKDENYLFTVTDDGVGIEMNERPDTMGLKIMSYRAGMIGASLDIGRNPDGGTIVKCVLPIT